MERRKYKAETKIKAIGINTHRHTRNKDMETVVMQTYMSMCTFSAPGMKLNMPIKSKMKTETEKKKIEATQTKNNTKTCYMMWPSERHLTTSWEIFD